jgi:hypothetical protein
MRILTAIFIFCAGAATAEDCAQSPVLHPSQLIAYEPLGNGSMSGKPAPEATPNPSVSQSPRPKLRPCRFFRIALEREKKRNRGAVCGDWTIRGEMLKPIKGKFRGCGIAKPVRIYTVSGIGLGQLALMDCETAITLKTWIEVVAKPAFADQGGGLIGLNMVGRPSF